MFRDYKAFMEVMRDSDFVERVPAEEVQYAPGKVCFLVLHGVRHKQTKINLGLFLIVLLGIVMCV